MLIDIRNVGKLIDKPFHDILTDFLVGQLAATEDDADFDFVAVLDEPTCMAGFRVEVVLADLRGELNLFQLRGLLILAGFLRGFLLLETEFSVVHDFADGRVGLRGDAVEVEPILDRQIIGGAG